MKLLNNLAIFLGLGLALGACQNNDIEVLPPAVDPIDSNLLTGQLNGDDYVWSWPAQNGLSMQVNVLNGTTLVMAETTDGTTFTHPGVDTNIEYTYVFKLTDGANLSSGVVKRYTRPGASKITGLSMSQLEKGSGYDALVEWDANSTATSIDFKATNGSKTLSEALPGSATSYTIPDVTYGEEWEVTVIAANNEGTSMKAATSLRIGKTAIGFLSVYSTPEELVANGDDDEASAWLWFHEEYPTGQFLPFASITDASDVDPFRVLFWMRDLEGVDETAVFTMPDVVEAATPVIRQWYADGGSLLLWSHATVYIGTLGRLDMDMLKGNDRAIGTGEGGFNGDTWQMAVSLNPGGKFTKDHSSHPIYRGIQTVQNDRCTLIPFKGPGWTEDHNCLFFNIPGILTGLGNQDEACYNTLTSVYGIYPLGTWDSQIDFVSQLNVWEAQQGNTEFKGTILCIGNGGCEFSMKNDDGTPDISAHPKNNQYQDNVLTLAKNSLEYLKTR